MTKQEFDLKYRGNKAVHCDTEEKANEFLALAHNFGYRWASWGSLLEENRWYINKEHTCYRLDDVVGVMLYCEKEYYEKEDYTIVEFKLDEPNGYAIEDTPSPMKENNKETTKENNMKYKVGDKVRVRSDLVVDKEYGVDVFVREMEYLKGKQVTIKKVYAEEYYIEEDYSMFYWTDEMLEPVKELKVGDVVYNKDGCKAKIVEIAFLIEYEKSGARFYKQASELYKTKPLKKITRDELADMGYELVK